MPPIANIAVELFAAACCGMCWIDAWRQGRRWLALCVVALGFSLGAEAFYLATEGPGSPGVYYEYGDFLAVIDAGPVHLPIWIGLGWSSILYASIWTVDQLAQRWWIRPITAGLLAVDIDLSLDPLAEQLGWWTWHQVGEVHYFGVPFDNFVGWWMIVAFFGGAWWALGDLAARRGWRGWELWTPVAAIPIALGLIAACQWLLVHAVYPAVGEPGGFLLVFGSALLSVAFGLKGARRDHPPNLAVMGLPVLFHGFLLAMLVLHLPANAALVVAIPAHLVLGAIVFAWPSLDTAAFRGRP
ncbi:MAG: carotenoid biosynthesis protein [Alphaproteobacteria bacterium]|nr:carotenoid biosynthesis protein [Alphaproteobacteria bacterium]